MGKNSNLHDSVKNKDEELHQFIKSKSEYWFMFETKTNRWVVDEDAMMRDLAPFIKQYGIQERIDENENAGQIAEHYSIDSVIDYHLQRREELALLSDTQEAKK